MGEPEEIIVDAARYATVAARAIWNSQRGPDQRLRLADVHRRLELLVAALFPDAPLIGVAEPPAPLPFLARLASPLSARARPKIALASTDGARLRLPAVMDGSPGDDALARYQLLALGQAARAARGTPSHIPGYMLERDLYLIAEATAADRTLATMLPGLRDSLCAERKRALEGREDHARVSARERAVEMLVRTVLGSDPTAPPPEVPALATPAESRRWASAVAARIRVLPGGYRGVPPVILWGTTAPAADAAPMDAMRPDAPARRSPPRTHTMQRRPRARAVPDDEDDARVGTWIVRADDAQETVEDPMGLQRPTDQKDGADPGELGDSLSELREAKLVRTPELPREILAGAEPLPRAPAASERASHRHAIVYPEWDYREGRYRAAGAVVREVEVGEGDSAWATRALERHATLVRRVRRDFERLRPRRETLRRQFDGSDIDVEAYVTTAADVHAGAAPDPRLYLADRRMRRDVAILLLVDVSASTDSWIAGSRRVIDVEREGLLIVEEALAALGDPHAIFAFRGQGAESVELLPLKRFAERGGVGVRGRIAALEPDGFTRVGAAVRHATALLARQPAGQRLLLLLSDGRPNDVDIYEGRYGLEDTRQAFAEARLQEVHPFCLTVDREAPVYASRVFGERGYVALRHPERLPQSIVILLKRLLCA